MPATTPFPSLQYSFKKETTNVEPDNDSLPYIMLIVLKNVKFTKNMNKIRKCHGYNE